MLPSRRLGRLAVSQRPRRFLSTERVVRHVAKPPLGASRAATRVESAAEALSLYRAEALSLSLLPSVHDAALALTPLWGVSLSSYLRWHRGSAAEALLHPTSSCDSSRTVSCSLPSAHLVTHPTHPRCYAPPRRAWPSDNASLRVPRWHGPPSCLMPLPSPPRSLAISIDHAVTLSSLFFPDHPHLAARSTTSSAFCQSMQVRGSAIQRAADAAMGVRRWESRRCRHSD